MRFCEAAKICVGPSKMVLNVRHGLPDGCQSTGANLETAERLSQWHSEHGSGDGETPQVVETPCFVRPNAPGRPSLRPHGSASPPPPGSGALAWIWQARTVSAS
jgi:hypothetical protein